MGRKICKFAYHFLNVLTGAAVVAVAAFWVIVIITIPATISHKCFGISLKNSIIINVSIIVGIAVMAGLRKLYELGEEYVLEDKHEKGECGETSEGRLENG